MKKFERSFVGEVMREVCDINFIYKLVPMALMLTNSTNSSLIDLHAPPLNYTTKVEANNTIIVCELLIYIAHR